MKEFKAGPELDRLIVEKVYGLQNTTFNPCARISVECSMALALLEKFSDGWLHHDSEGWRAGFGSCPYSDERDYDCDSGPQETAALAISIAALLCACTKDCPTRRLWHSRAPNRQSCLTKRPVVPSDRA